MYSLLHFFRGFVNQSASQLVATEALLLLGSLGRESLEMYVCILVLFNVFK